MSNDVIKACIVIIISAVFIIVLRSRQPEYAFLLTLLVVAITLIFLSGNLFGSIDKLQDLFDKSGNESVYFTTALKALGISYITGFASDVCRDFGFGALATTAETVGKIAIFVLSLPLAAVVLDLALKFVDL